MPPSPATPPRVLLRTAETLLIGALGGTVFTLLGFPAGLISGSLLSVAVAALIGRSVMVPRPLTRVISVLVGISLGAVVTPETLKGLISFPLSIAILLISTVIMVAATTSYLRFVHGWDAQTALFGASPGALAQVMTLAAEYGADMRKIAIVQVMRVVVLTIGIPTGLAYFGLMVQGGMMFRVGPPTTAMEVVILVAVSTATALLANWLRFPGGLMFGAMLGSAALHGSGYIHAILPWWVAAAAVVGIGSVTGSRFANTDPRTLVKYLGAALGSFAVAISVATLFVVLLTSLLSVRIPDTVVAFAPGAQDTMMVLALALHLDPIFVGAHHVSRFLLVSLALPLLAGRLQKKPPEKTAEQVQPPVRPTIED